MSKIVAIVFFANLSLILIAGLSVSPSEIYCSWHRPATPPLKDILDLPPTNRSIFFVETSCKSFKAQRLILSRRAACSVESAALNNPTTDIFVVFTAPALLKLSNDSVLRTLMSYQNVHLRGVNIERLAAGSTLEEEVSANGKLRKSMYGIVHASDIIRLLLLWRYGGIYMDTDVIVMHSIETLSRNFCGAENSIQIANGVIGFSNDTEGRELAMECIKDVKASFTGKVWGEIGPLVFTRLVKRKCDQHLVCSGTLKVYPSSTFYQYDYLESKNYFRLDGWKTFGKQLNKSFLLHVFNAKSQYYFPNKGSVYIEMAKKHCPRIYRVVRSRF